ncbi:MAG TPA: cyclic nucleotide-binding domain-containing protein [Solirubrobacteraceae bacterium]|nr:cyclic nucleotide-binding domain-containing protein [Solirubrobacteraceae bacterium]
MQTLDETIAAAPVFAGLSADQLTLIAGCARNERVSAGALLGREGDPANSFYLIRHGSVALELHAPGRDSLLIETLGDGDVVGWSWLFEPYRWQLDARATGPCALIEFDGSCLRGKCDRDHELGYDLMRRSAASLLETLQSTRIQLLDVYGHARAL